MTISRQRPLIWPLLALGIMLVLNVTSVPGEHWWETSFDWATLAQSETWVRWDADTGHYVGTLIDIALRAVPIMLVAFGMTLVIATAGVDLSVGAVMAIAGALAGYLLNRDAPPGLFALLASALGLCLVLGLWNGVLVAVFRVQPIVATLVLMVAGRGIAQLITDGQVPTFDDPAFGYLGRGYLLGIPFAVILTFGVLALLGAVTRLTPLGLTVEAIGDNPVAARWVGLRVRTVTALMYGISGLCAGLAGLFVASNIGAADANNAGLYIELDAILAAVIGGTSLAGGRFSLVGATLGALIIQTINNTLSRLNVPPEQHLVVKAVIVLLLCLLQSPHFRALFTRRRAAL